MSQYKKLLLSVLSGAKDQGHRRTPRHAHTDVGVEGGAGVPSHPKAPQDDEGHMGMAGMLLSQITFNVGMCLFVLPVMGLTLPFISYGGSSIITPVRFCSGPAASWA